MKLKILFTILSFVFLANCGLTKKEKIKITGKAVNAKLGAIVIANDVNGEDVVYYLDKIENWSNNVYGKTVTVSGYLLIENFPGNDESPYPVAYDGEKRTILKPKWVITED